MIATQGGLGVFFGDAIAEENTSVTIAIAVYVILFSGFVSVPLMLIWRAVTRYLHKNAIKNATYYASEGIDYYREKLQGLSPTMISMLVDHEIETTKDVTALVLKYSLMGVVSLDANAITVVNPSHPDLVQSDHLLLQAIEQKSLNAHILDRWKMCATEETLEDGRAKGYFTEAKSKPASSGRGCALGCLGSIVLVIATTAIALLGLDMDRIGVYLDAASDDLVTPYQQTQYLMSDPDMALQLLFLLILGILLFSAFVLPLVGLIRTVVMTARPGARAERTPLGEERAEQIAGMKNFIRDFSNLSQAEKGAIVVWDDFLIYAVVLEENESVTKDILALANINYDRLRIL